MYWQGTIYKMQAIVSSKLHKPDSWKMRRHGFMAREEERDP